LFFDLQISTIYVAKMVSQAWKALSEDEREKWEDIARQDKARFEMEKSMYVGPWKVPAFRRKGKDPAAPKRPMAASLSFANSNRSKVKAVQNNATPAEISRILATMWKEASDQEKKEYIDEEYRQRQEYKILMAEWNRRSEAEVKSTRERRENQAMEAVRERRFTTQLEATTVVATTMGSDRSTIDHGGSFVEYSTRMAMETFGSESEASLQNSCIHSAHMGPRTISSRGGTHVSMSSNVDNHRWHNPTSPSHFQDSWQHSGNNVPAETTSVERGHYAPEPCTDRTAYDPAYDPCYSHYQGASRVIPNYCGQPSSHGYFPRYNSHGKVILLIRRITQMILLISIIKQL
jgi:hypothetical protein